MADLRLRSIATLLVPISIAELAAFARGLLGATALAEALQAAPALASVQRRR